MKIWIFCLALFVSITAAAQDDQDKIETDRPDQSETPYTVPKNWFQAELGINREDVDAHSYNWVHPTALLKYGLSKNFEFRVEANPLTESIQMGADTKNTTGIEPIEIGGKLALSEEKGLLPKTSLLAHVGLPFLSSRAFRTSHLAPSFRFAMQNSVSKKVSLGYNLGAEWDGESSSPSWLYTFGPGIELSENWYVYIEAFGFIHKNELSEHSFDAGVAYMVSKNIRIDLSGGMGLSKNAFDHYIAVGFSFRLPVGASAPVH